MQAVLDADALVTTAFLDTLGTVIAPMNWTGYPPVDNPQYEACAVTYRGPADSTRGWWLHYTQHHDQLGDPRHALTLTAPCACGTYLSVELPDEDTLIRMLDELNTPPGTPVACDHRLRIRAASYGDPSHDSFEQPF
ncbi:MULTISPECIES: hypothetical protein [Streptomyces]|uniref:hypothetical protein n=1 Tax=Streptomyces TaxID=1883 RepID=UPI00345BCA45